MLVSLSYCQVYHIVCLTISLFESVLVQALNHTFAKSTNNDG